MNYTIVDIPGRPDYRQILELLVLLWPDEWGQKTDDEKVQFWEDSDNPDCDTSRLLKAGDLIIGFSRYSLWPRDAESPHMAHVYDIAVHPEYRKQGLGRMMMLDMIEGCRRKGIDTLLSRSLRSNKGSMELHRRMGFKVHLETVDSVVWEYRID